MKHQYFGDKRDLFKFDLVEKVLEGIKGLTFSYIPMLTPNDNKGHGEQRNLKLAKIGAKNSKLQQFLIKYGNLSKEKRSIYATAKYFGKSKTNIYKKFFQYSNSYEREEYFNGISARTLNNSCVLIDPDTGIEVKNSTEEHILYSEINKLFYRMKKSVLIIFQFMSHYNNKEDRLKGALSQLKNILNSTVYCIYDSQNAFFIIPKGARYNQNISRILNDYKKEYPQLGLAVA